MTLLRRSGKARLAQLSSIFHSPRNFPRQEDQVELRLSLELVMSEATPVPWMVREMFPVRRQQCVTMCSVLLLNTRA